ncbi:hypothetical protein [Streptomyces griseus]|uniref:hypothetical protein n=1 Tax=Streptomyces griseus TaxID=1911 RepID=UPI00056434F3|nr:hypothetical protein [Streptomyces griseus]
MPDRSLRLSTLPPQPPHAGLRGAVLLRERPASPPDAPSGDTPAGDAPSGDAPSGGRSDGGKTGGGRTGGEQGGGPAQEDNPFAPPPEGTPDRPWRPRHPAPDGQDDHPTPPAGAPWGSQWSDRQPGRSQGGFGERPGAGPEGPGGPGGGPDRTPRWDLTDPTQRRARYALMCGMWAFFFAISGWPYVALLLGALALYWGISSLRAKPGNPDPAAANAGARPKTTAAVSGLVTASLAIALVAITFTAQLVYRDYYTCTSDALTSESKQSCKQLLPEELRGVLGVGN